MSQISYDFKQIDDQKWGIYASQKLLATISSYEACQSIYQSLLTRKQSKSSYADNLKAKINYQQSLNKNLTLK